jgi:hypothetical protein
VDVQHRYADGHSGDSGLVGEVRTTKLRIDKAHLRRRSPVIEADDAIEAGQLRELIGKDYIFAIDFSRNKG